jgi:hypothetical protein
MSDSECGVGVMIVSMSFLHGTSLYIRDILRACF